MKSHNLNQEIVTQLEKSGLIQKLSGHTNRHTLSAEYDQLVNDDLKIGKKYMVKEIEQLLLALQGNTLKIGVLEANLSTSLNRNQLKYLAGKLFEDDILQKEGRGSGTAYTISTQFSHLRGDVLIKNVIDHLKAKYKVKNSLNSDRNSPK